MADNLRKFKILLKLSVVMTNWQRSIDRLSRRGINQVLISVFNVTLSNLPADVQDDCFVLCFLYFDKNIPKDALLIAGVGKIS